MCRQHWPRAPPSLQPCWSSHTALRPQHVAATSAPGHAQTLAFTAVAASAINIGGGFTITNRMLNMFRRPTDPAEYNNLYAIPGAVLVGGCAAGQLAGTPAYSTHACRTTAASVSAEARSPKAEH